MKKCWLIFCVGLVGLASASAFAKYEQEQLAMETQLQQRIEGILSRTLPPNSYLVTIKVEMENRERAATRQTTARRGGNSMFQQNNYVLPGVPQKKEFAPPQETTTETTVNTSSPETLIKRILISILVSQDVTAEQIRAVRDVISTSIPFNPLRGDEMDIQNSPLLKSTGAMAQASEGAAVSESGPIRAASSFGSVSDRSSPTTLVFLGAFCMAFLLFVGFLFGPVRAFLNKLLTVLPRIGEQAAYAVSNAPTKNPAASTTAAINPDSGSNGHGFQESTDEGVTRPFRFIREHQLSKLSILFRDMEPAQCALVLAYLPPEWSSKILGTLDARVQTVIMEELSQPREVPPEIVTEIENQIKSKLPYLVGGEEWIQSVYELTQPQTQRVLLGTLNLQSPELAQNLRRKTFFLEDLNVISAGSLRLVLQEAGYSTAALALHDETPENRGAILNKLPVAMREILQQEFDLSGEDPHAMLESKMRLLAVGRRMLAEGRISLPEQNDVKQRTR